MELSGPKIKNFPIFPQKIFFHIFWEMELSGPKLIKFHVGTFRARKIKKTHSEKNFLSFGKRNLLAPSLFFLYISRKVLQSQEKKNLLYFWK